MGKEHINFTITASPIFNPFLPPPATAKGLTCFLDEFLPKIDAQNNTIFYRVYTNPLWHQKGIPAAVKNAIIPNFVDTVRRAGLK